MQASDWIAVGAALISLISAGFTVFYARTQHRLNKMQVAEKERELAEQRIVMLRAELIKRSGTEWILRTTNISKGTALAVIVGCQQNEGIGSLLTNEDIGDIVPVAKLPPGNYFDIRATNWYGMQGPQSIWYNWNNEAGEVCTTTLKVLID